MPTLTITHEDLKLSEIDGYQYQVYTTGLIKIEESENKRLQINSFNLTIDEGENKDDYFHHSRIEFHHIQGQSEIYIYQYKDGNYSPKWGNNNTHPAHVSGYYYQFIDVDLLLEKKEFSIQIDYELN